MFIPRATEAIDCCRATAQAEQGLDALHTEVPRPPPLATPPSPWHLPSPITQHKLDNAGVIPFTLQHTGGCNVYTGYAPAHSRPSA